MTADFLVEGRTLYPGSVVTVDQKPDLVFGKGSKNRKLGGHIEKGPCAGMPIYMLTLQERASCPPCPTWDRCYANAMPWAKRVIHGPELESRISEDLVILERRHRRGFAVRLHQLGDFYSTHYVALWEECINRFPALHVFGFTAWSRTSDVGRAILDLTRRRWDRFAIRFSGALQAQGAHVIRYMPKHHLVGNGGIVCPEQIGKTESCGTCGLCWHPAAKDKAVVFIEHGAAPAPPVRRETR